MGLIVAIMLVIAVVIVRGVLRDRDRFGGRAGNSRYTGRRNNPADSFFAAGANPLLWTDDNKDNHGHHGHHGHHGDHGHHGHHHDSGWGGGHGDHGGGWSGGDGGGGGGDCGGGGGGGGD
ncbi:hypothetical protein ['Paenibacillus yunnanensis' Narsing Rao et al. 2020]|uniref:hypothetical protein n=1 Tax=Paenibacillus tengchongensis TaxID=2608684 RepID=UPI00165212B6|nr:hypothetical protein [Paenibacillus tengchongensis]